jgi:hypothetical protein
MGRNFPIVHIAQPEAGGVLFGAAGLTFMPNKRGNPNWGRPMQPASVLCTEFDLQVRQLRLAPENYVASTRLRRWCEENKNQYYIPEWLLKTWNMSVNSDLSGAA